MVSERGGDQTVGRGARPSRDSLLIDLVDYARRALPIVLLAELGALVEGLADDELVALVERLERAAPAVGLSDCG